MVSAPYHAYHPHLSFATYTTFCSPSCHKKMNINRKAHFFRLQDILNGPEPQALKPFPWAKQKDLQPPSSSAAWIRGRCAESSRSDSDSGEWAPAPAQLPGPQGRRPKGASLEGSSGVGRFFRKSSLPKLLLRSLSGDHRSNGSDEHAAGKVPRLNP